MRIVYEVVIWFPSGSCYEAEGNKKLWGGLLANKVSDNKTTKLHLLKIGEHCIWQNKWQKDSKQGGMASLIWSNYAQQWHK